VRIFLYAGLFVAAMAYALRAAFGEALFADRGAPVPEKGSGDSRRPLVAAFFAGFGGAGALLEGAHRLSAPAVLALAAVTGLLLALLLAAITRLFHP